MVKENKLKSGFSLVEVLIAMLLMSLFFLASTKIITMKPPQEVQEKPHGYYECYMPPSGIVTQHKSLGNALTLPVQNSDGDNDCVFEPPKGVPFANIYYIDNFQGYFFNIQEPQLNETITLEGGPSGLLGYYIVSIGEDLMRQNYEENGQNVFRAYLETAHPRSEILKLWDDSCGGTNANGCFMMLYGVFIAW